MEKLALENFGVYELDENQMKEIDGGIAPLLVAVVAGFGAAYTAGYAVGSIIRNFF